MMLKNSYMHTAVVNSTHEHINNDTTYICMCLYD